MQFEFILFEFAYVQLYAICIHEVAFMFIILLPKRGGMWSEYRGQPKYYVIY